MRLINIFKVLLCSSLLVLSGIAFAGKGSTSSKSMSRGFSSSRSAPSMSSARPTSSSFGSFGKQASMNTQSGGAFNRDLANRQAQNKAMRNWDDSHRPNTAQVPNGVPSPNSTGGNTRYEQRNVPHNYPSEVTSPSMPIPTVTTSSGPNMNGVMTGIVLGQVLSHPRTVYANGSDQNNSGGRLEPVTAEGEFKQSQIPVDSTTDVGGTQAPLTTHSVLQPIPQPMPQPTVPPATANSNFNEAERAEKSTGVLGWMLILGVFASVVWYARRRMKATQQATNGEQAKPHYSL